MQGTDTAELGVFTDPATGTAIVICALDNLGKGAAGQAVQNANLALGLSRPTACGSTGVIGLSVTAARASSPRASRGDPARASRPRGRPLDPARDRCGDVHAQPGAGSAVVISQQHLLSRPPAGRRDQLGRGERRDGRARRADARATAEAAAGLIDLAPEEVLVLSTGVIGARLPLHRLLTALDRRLLRFRPRAAPTRPTAIMTTDTRHEDGGRRTATASRSAAWRRARG